MVAVLVTTYAPFPTLSLSLPETTTASELSRILEPICPRQQQYLSTLSGHSFTPSRSTLSSLRSPTDDGPIMLRLSVRMLGGKGGFASQLRAQGGRMTSNKASNKDSCRDLSGRRLSTVKEAERLAKFLESEPDRKAAKAKEAAARLEKLKAEIKRLDEGLAGTGATATGTGTSAGAAEGASSAGGAKKRKLDDHEFVEQSREMVENVKDAVKEAMMRKRKKAKEQAAAKSGTTATTSAASSSKVVSTSA